jgi:thiamine biosynthesis lipoprotein
MGSPCEVQLYAPDAERLAAIAVQEVERLEQLYSRYRPSSFLSQINRVAEAGGSIDVDDETAGLFDYAGACYDQSDGLFDITSGILRRAWRFKEGLMPRPGEIEALLDRVGWDKMVWRRPRLEFPVPGLEIDFGGVVNEYAVDRLAVQLREAGVTGGVVNLGGDIRVIGPRADDQPWRVGVRHPREGVAAHLNIREGALASSGDYERRIVLDGVAYGHILNPKTGWPVRRLAAVSVIAELCVVAGSAATIAMLKEDAGPAWLDALGLPHLWITVDGQAGGPLASTPSPLAGEGGAHSRSEWEGEGSR